MAKLKLDFPNRPIGASIMIPSIKGEFVNGETYEVDSLSEDLVLPVGSYTGADDSGTNDSTDDYEGDDE